MYGKVSVTFEWKRRLMIKTRLIRTCNIKMQEYQNNLKIVLGLKFPIIKSFKK